jgi:hypothetical protein
LWCGASFLVLSTAALAHTSCRRRHRGRATWRECVRREL